MRFSRRSVTAAGIAAIAGIGPAWAQTSDDMSLGAANAPVSLEEYASTTCSHCAEFHEHNWSTLKTQFIDTGRVRLTLREVVTPPPNVAFAMFQLARCQGADANEYFRRLAILFQRQAAIFQSANGEALRQALVAIGGEWGLTEAQIMASFSDQAGAERLRRSIAESQTRGVTGTPSFFINGERVTDPAFHTTDGMARLLNQAAG